MGTPELASIGLKTLLESDFFDISLVVTQEDKSVGRGLKIIETPVKKVAKEYNKEVLQPKKIKEITERIKEENPDLIVVIAYGKIIPKEILDIPTKGCVNVHGSLLPKYRGSSCIQATILNGDKEGGITIMKMDEKMDTGDIIKKISTKLDEDETSKSLMEKIKVLTEEKLVEVLKDYVDNKLEAKKQNEEEASYVKMIDKKDGALNFKEETASNIERKVRAYFPWPGTYAYIEDLQKKQILFKILKLSKEIREDNNHKPGELFLEDNKLFVKCKDKAIEIKTLQLEGKKAMEANEFLKGNSWVLEKGLFV